MTLDLGDIGQTTNRESEELSLQGSSDRFPDRCLSNTRGANETDDLAFHSSAKLSDGQELQNPVLDILQSVVVLVQDVLSISDRVVFFGMLAPRDLRGTLNMNGFHSLMETCLGDPFQVISRDIRLGSGRLKMA